MYVKVVGFTLGFLRRGFGRHLQRLGFLRFRVYRGLGFRVEGSECKVFVGFRVQGLGFRV